MCQERSRKQCFTVPVKLVQPCLSAGMVWHRLFNPRGGAVKYVQACVSAWKDLESSFHHRWGPVKLVQACLSVRKEPEGIPCSQLEARRDLESSFHHCGSPVRLINAPLAHVCHWFLRTVTMLALREFVLYGWKLLVLLVTVTFSLVPTLIQPSLMTPCFPKK